MALSRGSFAAGVLSYATRCRRWVKEDKPDIAPGVCSQLGISRRCIQLAQRPQSLYSRRLCIHPGSQRQNHCPHEESRAMEKKGTRPKKGGLVCMWRMTFESACRPSLQESKNRVVRDRLSNLINLGELLM